MFAHYRSRFELLACRYVRNRTVAEDIVSESFMTLWENRERLDADCNLPAYVLTVVRNKCLDWLRAEARHAEIEQRVFDLRREVVDSDIRSLEAFDPREIFSAEVERIIRETLNRMPPLTRQVFEARRFEELSYREIAESCNISVRRVESELAKAAKAFKTALKDYLPELAIVLTLCGFGY